MEGDKRDKLKAHERRGESGEHGQPADSYGRRYLRLSSGNGFIASFITTSTHVILRRRHNSSFAAPLQCSTPLFH